MTVKCVIGTGVSGMSLAPALLHEFFAVAPEAFDGPIPHADLMLEGQTPEDFEYQFKNSIYREDALYLFRDWDTRLRIHPWLVAKVEELGPQASKGRYGDGNQVVEVNEGFYIWEDDDGSEHISYTE